MDGKFAKSFSILIQTLYHKPRFSYINSKDIIQFILETAKIYDCSFAAKPIIDSNGGKLDGISAELLAKVIKTYLLVLKKNALEQKAALAAQAKAEAEAMALEADAKKKGVRSKSPTKAKGSADKKKKKPRERIIGDEPAEGPNVYYVFRDMNVEVIEWLEKECDIGIDLCYCQGSKVEELNKVVLNEKNTDSLIKQMIVKQIPNDINDGKTLFDNLAKTIYDIFEKKKMWKTLYERTKVLPVNKKIENVDMRYYNSILNDVPMESVTVELIIEAIIEDVIHGEEMIKQSQLLDSESANNLTSNIFKVYTDYLNVHNTDSLTNNNYNFASEERNLPVIMFGDELFEKSQSIKGNIKFEVLNKLEKNNIIESKYDRVDLNDTFLRGDDSNVKYKKLNMLFGGQCDPLTERQLILLEFEAIMDYIKGQRDDSEEQSSNHENEEITVTVEDESKTENDRVENVALNSNNSSNANTNVSNVSNNLNANNLGFNGFFEQIRDVPVNLVPSNQPAIPSVPIIITENEKEIPVKKIRFPKFDSSQYNIHEYLDPTVFSQRLQGLINEFPKLYIQEYPDERFKLLVLKEFNDQDIQSDLANGGPLKETKQGFLNHGHNCYEYNVKYFHSFSNFYDKVINKNIPISEFICGNQILDTGDSHLVGADDNQSFYPCDGSQIKIQNFHSKNNSFKRKLVLFKNHTFSYQNKIFSAHFDDDTIISISKSPNKKLSIALNDGTLVELLADRSILTVDPVESDENFKFCVIKRNGSLYYFNENSKEGAVYLNNGKITKTNHLGISSVVEMDDIPDSRIN
ncbi:hypothetical protein ROZALSC1DRAFT_22799, partial [Rozella allomycis CSF55]